MRFLIEGKTILVEINETKSLFWIVICWLLKPFKYYSVFCKDWNKIWIDIILYSIGFSYIWKKLIKKCKNYLLIPFSIHSKSGQTVTLRVQISKTHQNHLHTPGAVNLVLCKVVATTHCGQLVTSSCFAFGRFWIQILDQRQAILTYFCGFLSFSRWVLGQYLN